MPRQTLPAIIKEPDTQEIAPEEVSRFYGGYFDAIPTNLENSFDAAIHDGDRLSIDPELAVLRLFNSQLLKQLDPNSAESRFRNLDDAKNDLEAARACGDQKLLLQAVDQMLFVMNRQPDESAIRSEFRMNAEAIRKLAESEIKRLHRSLQVMYQTEVNNIRTDLIAAIRKNVTHHDTLEALASDISRILTR